METGEGQVLIFFVFIFILTASVGFEPRRTGYSAAFGGGQAGGKEWDALKQG